MESEEKSDKLLEFFKSTEPELRGSLNEALYSCAELNLFVDEVDSVSHEQALFLWKVVEKLRTNEFPKELEM